MTASSELIQELTRDLTPEQRQAVVHLDGPLLVLAGPGSGKTTVVTKRIAHLIAQGIPPWQILALTFTNKAAAEMRERVERLLPDETGSRRGLTVTTFHAFCARMLRRYAETAGLQGLSRNFTIYDTADQRDAVKRALTQCDMSSKHWTPASVLSTISGAKNRLVDAKGFAAEASDFYSKSISKAFTAYEKILRDANAVDFDDLLLLMSRALKQSELVRGELQQRYQYIMIDEYQDTNHAQFVIAHTLAAAHRNLCVVGDPDQSIYGWRGADIRNILEFETQYADALTIPLGQNFRSTGHIVAAAAKLISHNKQRKDKRLHTQLEEGAKPELVMCTDEHHEASLIVDWFRTKRDEEAVAWKDMAVLYRTNALSRVVEEAFRREAVPYVVARGTAFYERKEIKDALAYLRVVHNPNDEISVRRIINAPTRGIGKTTLDRIEVFATDRQLTFFDALAQVEQINDLTQRAQSAVLKFVAMVNGWRAFAAGEKSQTGSFMGVEVERPALADLVERVVSESGLEKAYKQSKAEEDLERLENLSELISAAADFEPAVEEDVPPVEEATRATPQAAARERNVLSMLGAFLESIALVSDADAIDPESGVVTLLTLHAAKGLEYACVAMAGLEEGVLPHMRAIGHEEELEEERRLCFVGMTRAKRHLLMTSAAVRTHRGLRERTISSQFLREVPDDAVIRLDLADQGFGGYRDLEDDFLDPARSQRSRGGGGRGGSDFDEWGGRSASRTSREEGDFALGELVRHPKFGLGRIEAIVRRPTGSSARVNFMEWGVKTLMLEYAGLERVE